MKIVLSQFVSLDGVSQGPGSPDEDRSDGFSMGGWFVPFLDKSFIDLAAGSIQDADGFLFGRRTYEAFARDWPNIDDPNDPFTVLINTLPKYVVSNTLKETNWKPTTIISGNVIEQLTELRNAPGRELQIQGSAKLSQSLLAAGLIDEIRLVIAPVILGKGRRLFPVGGASSGLKLVSSRTTDAGLTLQTYEYVGEPQFASYPGVSEIIQS